MTEHRTNDDLLSAYFDGEATPVERAEAERLLQASPQARRELAEIGEVADLLRSLPHERLPEHFAAQVLARAEREMLLAAPAGTTPAASGRRRAARWFALGSLIATAAAVVVMTSLMGPPEYREEVAGRGDRRGGEDARVADRADRPSGEREGEGVVLANELGGPRGGRTPPDVADREVEKLENRLAGAAARATNAPAPEEAMPPADAPLAPRAAPTTEPSSVAPRSALDGARGSERGNLVRERMQRPEPLTGRAPPEPSAAGTASAIGAAKSALDLDNVRVGEIVRFAQESDNGVAVVELTVVDVRQAAGALDVLLVQNGRSFPADEAAGGFGARPAQPEASAAQAAAPDEDDRKRAAEAAPGRPAGELLAVYVESPGSRLALALEEMQRRGLLENPQLVTSVDPRQVAVDLEEREAAEPAPGEPPDENDALLKEPGKNRTTLAAAVERQKVESTRQRGQQDAPTGRGDAPAEAPDVPRPPEADATPAAPNVALRTADGAAQPMESAPDDARTFRLEFRPDESLLADRNAASRARRFTRPGSRAVPNAPAVPEGSRAEDPAAAPGDRLRVIFIFRQSG